MAQQGGSRWAGLGSLGMAVGLLVMVGLGDGRAAVRVEGAVFLPDRHAEFPWTETAKGIEHWYAESYRAAGLVRLWVQNRGEGAISAAALQLGGQEYGARGEMRGQQVVWWRLRPDPLPPGAYGQVEIRLREPLTEPSAVRVRFASGEQVEAVVQPRGKPLRLGRVGFTASGAAVLWCSLAPNFAPRVSLWVDGRQAAGRQCTWLGPWKETLGVIYQPPRPWEYGSFHYFALKAGEEVLDGAVVRVRDDFFPLGTYGYVTPREYAANSLNLYVSFGALSGRALDELAAYGLRAVTPVGKEVPRGHAGIWAYYLRDEPDCADYFVEGLPHAVRVGTMGMEMVARDRECYGLEPQKLTYLTIDQTYKPANWLVYGPVADVAATDHYPPWGKEKEVFSTVENCRLACAPQMLVFIFRAWWPEPKEPRPEASAERMMFAEEERLHIGWGLAGGAQGLVCYIHCTEPAGESIFHGAGEFPDVWQAIGAMYREIALVAPVLGTAWPVDGVVQAPGGIFARALVGYQGMVVVGINEGGCKSSADDFVVEAARQVRLRVALPPWLRDCAVAEVGEGSLRKLEMQVRGGWGEVCWPRVDTARLLLLAAPAQMRALEDSYARLWTSQARATLAGRQAELREAAKRLDLVRRMPGRYKDFVVYGQAQGAYGVQVPKDYWNPRGEQYNAWEWYGAEKPQEHWVQWRCKTGQGGEHYFIFLSGLRRPLTVSVRRGEGTEVLQGRMEGQEGVCALKLNLPGPGEYVIRLAGAGEGESGARLSRAAYLVPAARATLLPETLLELK
jgi:hypothetical protein